VGGKGARRGVGDTIQFKTFTNKNLARLSCVFKNEVELVLLRKPGGRRERRGVFSLKRSWKRSTETLTESYRGWEK